ncbi:MAG: UDP-N-acetylglucosamine 1-carboxyvinyltransferase [Patescibacteria group bacterium]
MKMRIRGGKHLRGHVPIYGAKNASGPLIAAALLLKGPVRFKNVPRLTDLLGLLEIMQDMGVKVGWEGAHELMIDATKLDASKLDKKKMKRMRFSILLLGPMLARVKRVSVGEPGGCSIGNRPIDAHLFALGALGANIETDDDGTLAMDANGKGLTGAYVVLPEPSVTATENLVMAAVTAKGHTSVRLAAAEPHVADLCRFLNACGAKIKGVGTHELEIDGVTSLKPPKKTWTVIPDMLEIGTFAAAAAITRGDITMSPVDMSHLDAVLSALSRVGVKHKLTSDGALRVQGVSRMTAISKLQANIYPCFPTDLQALFGLLATQCHGTTLIQDPLFEGRMGYVNELLKMGANAVIADPHRVVITGPTPLRGTEIRSLDLRAGATMVLAGLIAEGETVIHDAEMVYRGYEDLDGRLRALGAEIEQLHD